MNTYSDWSSEGRDDGSRSRARRGRPGGPGFEQGSEQDTAARSPWLRSQRLWSESGAQWDVPAQAPQARYQGRHTASALPAVLLGAPVLGAPVLAVQETAQFQAPGQKHGTSRRVVTVVLPAAVLATVGAVAIALLTGSGSPRTPHTIGIYPGQQWRGVFQRIDTIAVDGDMVVTTGSQSTDGHVRQQFFVSADGGATWRLASVRAAGGGQPPLGHAASLIARGPAGWLAVGPRAIWTSPDGLSWTLAAAHGITPSGPGDQVRVLTGTAGGFLAGGTEGGQGVVWVSRDLTSWQQPPLALAPGETLRDISSAASLGPVTVISGTVARGAATSAGVWLSADGGSSWTRVAVPADHGAADGIAGVGSDAAGLLAVRPGRAGGGVAYFSPDGLNWRYAGTIDPAGGWTPVAVRGGHGGFVVTGQTATGTIVAYTGTGTSAAWTPTGSLGTGLSPAVAAGGTVLAAGSTAASATGQRAVLLEANRTGRVRSVPLAGIPGAVVPELAVNAVAAAGDVQVAAGSADGYPAIWRRQHGGSWTLVSAAPAAGQDHMAALTGVARGPEGWLAMGLPGPVAFTSADGVTWRPAAGKLAQDLAGASAVTVAAGPAGYVVAGGQAGVWWSPDLTSWSRVNDGQVLAVAADAHGFVSVGSHDGQPAVWTTADGRTWTGVALAVPAGASSAVLQRVAIEGSRVAVLGQATTTRGVVPFALLSVNGGATWLKVPFASPGPDTTFTALIAGPGGFTAAGQYGPPGRTVPAAWTSADGTAWNRAPLSGLTSDYRITALVPAGLAGSAGPTATAIGSVATQRGQGAFEVSVPSR